MKKQKSEYAIQAVGNALQVLEAFGQEDELGVTDLAQRLGLHKNNVFRLLATLEQGGYVEQSAGNGRYRLGPACLELGQAFARAAGLLPRARSILEELVRSTGESAHLGVLREFEVVHLDGEQAQRLVLTVSRIGLRLPVHCTALGKVLVGCGPESTQQEFDRRLCAGEGLQPRTESTIVDRDKLFEHLRGVKVQGFAVDVEECETGLCCAAAPVYESSGSVVAALSISVPRFRTTPESLVCDLVPAVVSAADRLSAQMGFGAR